MLKFALNQMVPDHLSLDKQHEYLIEGTTGC